MGANSISVSYWIELFRQLFVLSSGKVAHTFLFDGKMPPSLTYSQSDYQAQAIAAHLQATCLSDERQFQHADLSMGKAQIRKILPGPSNL